MTRLPDFFPGFVTADPGHRKSRIVHTGKLRGRRLHSGKENMVEKACEKLRGHFPCDGDVCTVSGIDQQWHRSNGTIQRDPAIKIQRCAGNILSGFNHYLKEYA
jgi:hypothetical protein